MRPLVTVLCAALVFAIPCPADEAEVAARVESAPLTDVDAATLQTIVEGAVAQKLRPLQREIAELRDEVRLHDILGGIGYIVGIAGIAFYFLGVRRRERGGGGGA